MALLIINRRKEKRRYKNKIRARYKAINLTTTIPNTLNLKWGGAINSESKQYIRIIEVK